MVGVQSSVNFCDVQDFHTNFLALESSDQHTIIFYKFQIPEWSSILLTLTHTSRYYGDNLWRLHWTFNLSRISWRLSVPIGVAPLFVVVVVVQAHQLKAEDKVTKYEDYLSEDGFSAGVNSLLGFRTLLSCNRLVLVFG